MLNQLMSSCVNSVALVSALSFLILSGVLLVECFAALLPTSKRATGTPQSSRVAVLVPAHNEELGLNATLTTVLPQLNSHDRLVVIADNCTDATPEIARKAGAIVLERQDLTQIGKGYALDYGVRYLAADPPDVVIVIDADCHAQPDAIARLKHMALTTGRPAQATYLMEKPAVPSSKDAVSAFAFTVKNLVRPLGLSQLNLPCLLTGTGMAFPWAAIRSMGT
jgi:glycosyltransferase involved in cell wall biosynthesis